MNSKNCNSLETPEEHLPSPFCFTSLSGVCHTSKGKYGAAGCWAGQLARGCLNIASWQVPGSSSSHIEQCCVTASASIPLPKFRRGRKQVAKASHKALGSPCPQAQGPPGKDTARGRPGAAYLVLHNHTTGNSV